MATLTVTASPGPTLTGYNMDVDGNPVHFAGHTGSVTVSGSCGDGSSHRANYGFFGPAGSTFGFVITCNGNPVCTVVGARVPAATAPNAADSEEFNL